MPPSDIDPQSGFRLPLPKRDDLDEAGKRAYDRAATPGKTVVGLRGPAGIHLYSTGAVDARNQFAEWYLRQQAGFDPTVREVAILAVAREMDSRFEWAAHEPEALQVGVPADIIDIIKHRKSTQGLDETYAAIIELGRQAADNTKSRPPPSPASRSCSSRQTCAARHAHGHLCQDRNPARRPSTCRCQKANRSCRCVRSPSPAGCR